jgi:DNA phosphorothioation-associated DGQHR protein 1
MLKLPVLEINQPFGIFYAVKVKSSDLLKVVESDPYRALENGTHTGTQRQMQTNRLKEISEYLKGVESALPNSIIIAGNTYSKKEETRWRIVVEDNNKYLLIPKEEINGTIIDGQHRLNGFKMLSREERDKYELLCSVYMDIHNPYQAYLFATINMNQKKVSKSLAYELYGYNLDEENANVWSTEKLAVFLTRKLNFDKTSVFNGHIIVAAENDEVLFDVSPRKQDWFISTASIVDGILTLISSNSRKDRDRLQQENSKNRKRNVLEIDNTPLRKYYLEGNDLLIYTIVNNFFRASYDVLYKKDSYLFKTVGIQAQFNLLKQILLNHLEKDTNISVDYFKNKLKVFESIDFSDNFYTASGVGRVRISNTFFIKLGYKEIDSIKKEIEKKDYVRLLNL